LALFVCASVESFPGLPREEIFPILVDLEFSAVELPIHEEGQSWLRPSEVLANLEGAFNKCRETKRLTVAALSVNQTVDCENYYEQFAACCKLAKALKVVPLVVPAAELGTPFNAEIERLRELVRVAAFEGCQVALKTQIGCMTEDPATATVLCDNVKGLGLALDPSHYITGPWQGRDITKVMPYVYHVRLRDSTKTELNVRIGQGEIDYGKLLSQLAHVNYDRALAIDMPPLDEQDHRAELRKLRLLLESLL
jgi:sugar phosphate isomerase/epimerase